MSRIRDKKKQIFDCIRIFAAFIVVIFILSGCGNHTADTDNSREVSKTVETTVEKNGQTDTVEGSGQDDTAAGDRQADTVKKNGQTDETGVIQVSDVPEYSGNPYIVVNDNEPSFKKSEITDQSFETYSLLDSLGRCGVAIASVGQDIMPTEKRGAIGQVKPTGWHTVKYDSVDGKYLYNRCHLIGYQLTGENANEKNLITGTRYLNVEGMLPFEDMVADYVKETENHVMYRVTPLYEGNNLLASGVEMEGYSVEDQGEGICFHVYCYNVQPGIKLIMLQVTAISTKKWQTMM